jgi:ferric-dicitrate binding protein FerR (iron transport regulator)
MTGANADMTSIFVQAAHWWVVLREGDASTRQNREFMEWVKRAPEHVEAYLQFLRLQSALARPNLRWPAISAEALVSKALTESPVIPLDDGSGGCVVTSGDVAVSQP